MSATELTLDVHLLVALVFLLKRVIGKLLTLIMILEELVLAAKSVQRVSGKGCSAPRCKRGVP